MVKIVFIFLMYCIGIPVLGISIFPGVFLIYHVWVHTAGLAISLRLLYFCFVFVFGYFLSGAMLMLVVIAVRMIFRLRLKEGEFSIDSPEIFKWIFINAFFLAVKVAFMDFILMTPYCAMFYRFMGAKIGRNVVINSKNVMDMSLLEIGNNVVIGGNATVIGHSLGKDGLKLKKVKIGKNVIIGLNAVVFPGVEIGENSIIAAGAIVPKDTHIPANTTFFGPVIRG